MVRKGAALGLKPWHVYRMTAHELSTYAKGRLDAEDEQVEWLAWQTMYLLNVQLAKNDRMNLDDFLTEEHKARRKKRGVKERMRLTSVPQLKEHLRKVDLDHREAQWWASEEGRTVRERLDAEAEED